MGILQFAWQVWEFEFQLTTQLVIKFFFHCLIKKSVPRSVEYMQLFYMPLIVNIELLCFRHHTEPNNFIPK